MRPAQSAFAEQFPTARTWDLLDDQLSVLADQAGRITPELEARMLRLIDHAVLGGADAVQLTCSMYGPVTSLAGGQHDTPIRASDTAMQRAVIASGLPTAVVGSLATAVEDSIRRMHLLGAGSPLQLSGVTVPTAAEYAASGDIESLAKVVEEAIRSEADEIEQVALAQFSVSPARDLLERSLSIPVLSPPHAAANELRRVLDCEPQA